MAAGGSEAALVVGSAFMRDLGSLFPVAMTLSGDELVFTFVSSCASSDEVEQWVRERSGALLAGRVPRFFADPEQRRIGVELAGTRIGALILLADEVAAGQTDAPHRGRWQDQMPYAVRIALDELARMLSRCHHRTGGAVPLIDLNLEYRRDQDYQARLGHVDANMRPYIAPVRPTLTLHWRSATSGQRKAFLDELLEGAPGRNWLRRRRTVRLMGLELEVAP
ncbi:hypothetical protein FPZ12_035535 [Amycolatopsis acidicola]|uniref:Uncharacterized protein n=1 Tax=Amycolatopsis acidicola TaxID=2596893 RepID=A0A5N0UW01_9PSEU|nr:hypothetical protein [Amycolatopsis acidicola]KAA9153079.1 hypothetical protein FPZ12_035535 [Amycolatopsis acidicola]